MSLRELPPRKPFVPVDDPCDCGHEAEIAQLKTDLALFVEAAEHALDRLFTYDPNTAVIDELDRALDSPSVLALRRAK